MNQFKKTLACLLCLAMFLGMVTPVSAADIEDSLQASDVINEEITLTGITVTAPTKTAYLAGEELDTTGMVVTAVYSDDGTEVLTEGYEVTGYEPRTLGEQTVTVTYQELSATFTVTVEAETFTYCINGHTSHDGIDCAEPIVTWKYWNDENARANIENWGGTYKDGEYKTRMDGTGNWILQEDLTLAGARSTGSTQLRINLNGHNIISTVTSNSDNALAFNANHANGGEIALTDLSTEGEPGRLYAEIFEGVTPKFSYQGLMYASTGPIKLAGRVVVDASNLNSEFASGTAAIQLNSNMAFTMYGGTVKGMASTKGTASALHGWSGASIAIHGGEIISVDTEQAVYAPTNFTMTGGSITGTVQFGASASGTGVISISGDAMIDGTANVKGATSVAISGAPQIGTLQLASGEKVDLTGFTGETLAVNAAGTFTTNFANVAAAEAVFPKITSAVDGKIVTLSGLAFAMSTPSDMVHCINGHANHDGIDCAEPIVTWRYWNAANAETEFAAYAVQYSEGDEGRRLPGSNNWILTCDVALAGTRETGAYALRIDLNGHNITKQVTADDTCSQVFRITKGYPTEITDLSTEGDAGVIGAAIAEGVTPTFEYGALVYAGSSDFKLAGRAVVDASNMTTTNTSAGNAIMVNSNQRFVMYGGAVKGVASTPYHTGTVGGWNNTTIEIHGGELIDNAGKPAVYAGKDFIMTGGKAEGVQFSSGNAGAGDVSISGNAVITGTADVKGVNTITVSGNVQLENVKLAAGERIILGGELADTAKIAITGAAGYIVVNANNTDERRSSEYVLNGQITSATSTQLAVLPAGTIIYGGLYHCINGHTVHAGETADCTEDVVLWKYWNAETAATYGYTGGDAGDHTTKLTGVGNFILIDDIELSDQRTTGNGTLRIDLNGHTISRRVTAETEAGRARVLNVWDPNTSDTTIPELHLTDLSTEGDAGSVKLVYDEGVTTKPATGSLVYAPDGPFKLAGRAFLDATNIKGFTPVSVNAAKPFTMYGGTINNPYGYAVYLGNATTTADIRGNSVITGTFKVEKAASVNFSGNVQLSRLNITAGQLVTLGELEETAKMAVLADGVFTTAFANEQAAAAALSHVTAFNEDQYVVAESNALSLKTRVLTGITVTAPTKTEYFVGDELDTTGMVVTANYDNGTTKNVTKDAKLSEFDEASTGEQTVTVTYAGFTGTFTVTVAEPEIIGTIIAEGECGAEGDNVKWRLTEDGVLTIYGKGAMADYTRSVQPWSAYRTQIKTIVIKEGVTSIGKFAFYACKQVTTLTIARTVTSIGKYASDKLIRLAEVNYAFSAELLERITYPTGNTKLLGVATKNTVEPTYTELKLTAPTKEKYLVGETLDLTGMELVLVDAEGNETPVTENYIVYGFNSELPTTQTITVISESLYATFEVNVRDEGECGAEGSDVKWVVTDNRLTISGTGAIKDYARKEAPFYTKYSTFIKYVEIEEGITTIGKYALNYLVVMQTLYIPMSVTSIRLGATIGCSKLLNVYCSATEYWWNNKVNVNWNSAGNAPLEKTKSDGSSVLNFATPSLQTIEVTANTKPVYQAGEAFDLTSLTVVGVYNDTSTKTLTENLKVSGYDANKLYTQTVTISYAGRTTTVQVKVVQEGTCGEGLTWTIDEKVLTISGEGAMENYVKSDGTTAPWKSYRANGSITEVVIEEGVTSIGEWAFYYTKDLTSISIPSSVTTIGANAFNASAVTEVNYAGTETDWANVTVVSTGNTAIKNATVNYATAE